jgi:hypothetical protein
MSEAAGWDKLTKVEQRALTKLFGGDTTILKSSTVCVREASWMRTTRSPCLAYSFSHLQCGASKPLHNCAQVSRRSGPSHCLSSHRRRWRAPGHYIG